VSSTALSHPPSIRVGPVVSEVDVEQEVLRLFGAADVGLVVTVRGDAGERGEAFRELLDSLALYDDRYRTGEAIEVEPPDVESLRRALGVLGEPRVKRRLFERILQVFGSELLNPLGEVMTTQAGGTLQGHMDRFRNDVLLSVGTLPLTQETREVLLGDLSGLLTDEYIAMLADHEEQVQSPRVKEMAQAALHLIGEVFQRAFRHWGENASRLAESVHRRLGGRVRLKESPVVVRQRIVEGIEEFLWVETSTELSGALEQLFHQDKYRGVADLAPRVERRLYAQFAGACWDIIQDNC
jgi:hypothetical protein